MISHNNYQQWLKKGGKELFKNELCYFQNRPACASCGPCGRPGARGHRVGDPCTKVSMGISFHRNNPWKVFPNWKINPAQSGKRRCFSSLFMVWPKISNGWNQHLQLAGEIMGSVARLGMKYGPICILGGDNGPIWQHCPCTWLITYHRRRYNSQNVTRFHDGIAIHQQRPIPGVEPEKTKPRFPNYSWIKYWYWLGCFLVYVIWYRQRIIPSFFLSL